MFKWFKIRNFLDEHQEWHSLVIGWGDGVSFRSTDWAKLNVFYGDKEKMSQELHYYKFGLGLGLFSILGFITAMLRILTQ